MGASQKRRLLEAHNRTARKYKFGPKNMLHIESR